MKQCEFCGASMVNEASFCGKCGRAPSRTALHPTRISDIGSWRVGDDPDLEDENPTILSASGKHMIPYVPGDALHPVNLVPIHDGKADEEDDEEKRRRRLAFLGASLPLLEEIANAPTLGQAPVIQGIPPLSQPPVIQGVPPLGQAPVVQGMPPFPQGPTVPSAPPIQGGSFYGPGSAAPGHPPLWQPQPQPLPPHPSGGPIKKPGGPTGNSPGCLVLGLVLLTAILIILATTFGLGLTVFAPGANLALHGHNFLPNSSVTLILDKGIPLYSVYHQPPAQLASSRADSSTGLVLSAFLPAARSNIVSVGGNGTFNAVVQISSILTLGSHTVHATEGVSHRSASLPFTISQGSATATPTTTPTSTSTGTPTSTSTPTATTVGPPALSCITPTNLALGPISELSSQVASGSVTLCTTGAGALTWNASWDQNQAPWLKIDQSSGTVQAPDQIQTIISASATNLAAGTYTATVTFTAAASNTTQSVNVTLTVKAGCVSAAPQALRFSGVEGASNPAGSQAISLTNCGVTSDWSATINKGSKWLSLSSSKGTLKGEQTTSIAVTASNLNAGLKTGTYQDTITFTIGSDTATVSVTLVVQAPPTISASPTSVDAAGSPCSTSQDGGSSQCTITLTNNSSEVALTWSASSSISGVTVTANSSTIAAGGTEQVTINVPLSNCGTVITITFSVSGSTSTATVTWTCAVLE